MVKLLTGNELTRGDVLWWSGEGWSKLLTDAVAVCEEGPAIIRRESVHERVSDLTLIDAEAVDSGWRPLRVRERIRAYGPTVRADLSLPGQDWR